MNEEEIKFDHFGKNILEKIDKNILNTFTPEQINEIKSAYNKWWYEKSNHAIDIRGIIPFIFKRYYFCFLMGVDRRFSSNLIEMECRDRKSDSPWIGIFFWGFVFMIILAFSFLYFFFQTYSLVEILPKN